MGATQMTDSDEPDPLVRRGLLAIPRRDGARANYAASSELLRPIRGRRLERSNERLHGLEAEPHASRAEDDGGTAREIRPLAQGVECALTDRERRGRRGSGQKNRRCLRYGAAMRGFLPG